MKSIMLRHASNDFQALLTANGIANAGGEVFSITNNGPATPTTFALPNIPDYSRPQKFIVWARVRDNAHMDECDTQIEKCLNEQKC